MENQPKNLFDRLFDELKAGNPLYIVLGLFVVVLIAVVFVWQLINSPVNILPTKYSHPTTLARMKTLTAQAPPASATPAAASFLFMFNIDDN